MFLTALGNDWKQAHKSQHGSRPPTMAAPKTQLPNYPLGAANGAPLAPLSELESEDECVWAGVG